MLLMKEITVGTGVATLGYVGSFIYPIRYILTDINNINSARGTMLKLLGLLDNREKSLDKGPNLIPPSFSPMYPCPTAA